MEYSLAAAGEERGGLLLTLSRWAMDHMPSLRTAGPTKHCRSEGDSGGDTGRAVSFVRVQRLSSFEVLWNSMSRSKPSPFPIDLLPR